MTVSQTDPSDDVTHLRSQVDRATDPHDRRRALIRLASVLRRRRAHLRSIAELEELVKVGAEIISLTPGHYRDRIGHVTGWAENIRLRSVTKMDATELGRAIGMLAPELTRERPDCPTWVHTHVIAAHFELVQCLRERFKLTGDVNDLETGLDTPTGRRESPPHRKCASAMNCGRACCGSGSALTAALPIWTRQSWPAWAPSPKHAKASPLRLSGACLALP